jgi:hypothetical protein
VLLIDSQPTISVGQINCTTSGAVRIENDSTTTPIVFSRQLITHDLRLERNAKLITRGAPIVLGTGDGTANQQFSLASSPLDIIPYPSVVQVEIAGKSLPWSVIPDAGTTITIPRTEFEGGGYDVGNVVFWNATTRTLEFGDGTNGNVLPIGAIVRIANIYIHCDVNHNTPANRSLIDISPAGGIDMEWTAFTNAIYFANTAGGNVRMQNCGITGLFSYYSTNFGIKFDGFQVNPDSQQTNVTTAFNLTSIFGECELKRVRTYMGGLIAVAGKNTISGLYNIPSGKIEDCSFYIRQGYNLTSGEALLLRNLPTVREINNLCIGGQRLELTNISNIRFNDLKICRNTNGTSSVISLYGIYLANCQVVDFVRLGKSGSSIHSYYVLGSDDQTTNVSVFDTIYDLINIGIGFVYSLGDGFNIYNSYFPNIRNAGYLVFVSTAYLASDINMLNVRGSTLGTITNLSPTVSSEYNPVYCTAANFISTMSAATDFAFCNMVDAGENPTTGNLGLGSFSQYTGDNADKMQFTGTAQLNQLGGVELFVAGDTFTVESTFAIRGITGFDTAGLIRYTSTGLTNSTTKPSTIDFEFRLRKPNETYGSFSVLTMVNLDSELSALTNYNSDEGFFMEVRMTASANNGSMAVSKV